MICVFSPLCSDFITDKNKRERNLQAVVLKVFIKPGPVVKMLTCSDHIGSSSLLRVTPSFSPACFLSPSLLSNSHIKKKRKGLEMISSFKPELFFLLGSVSLVVCLLLYIDMFSVIYYRHVRTCCDLFC